VAPVSYVSMHDSDISYPSHGMRWWSLVLVGVRDHFEIPELDTADSFVYDPTVTRRLSIKNKVAVVGTEISVLLFVLNPPTLTMDFGGPDHLEDINTSV
jgi:hypothetical protein